MHAPSGMRVSTAAFMRACGLLMGCMFVSNFLQLDVLLGTDGLSPASRALVPRFTFTERPTLAWWLGSSTASLTVVMGLGVLGAALMVADRLRPVGPLLVATAHLSVIHVGGPFFLFQWDNLVIEVLLLLALVPRARGDTPHPVVVLALRFLVFRVLFESGVVKAAWGTHSWQVQHAMDRYYETAPLPLMLGWWMHQLPRAFHVAEEVATFLLELGVPLLFFAPRRVRAWSVIPSLLLQAVIAATASYGAFNFLCALLLLFMVDDGQWQSLQDAARRSSRIVGHVIGWANPPAGEPGRWRHLVAPVAGAQAVMGLVGFVVMMAPERVPQPLHAAWDAVQPWRWVNNYHLFADITQERPVVEIQVSDDAEHWTPLHFRFAPGEPTRAPPLLLAPHHPRVPFQAWFLALSGRSSAWFERLLDGVCRPESPVHGLFVEWPYRAQAPVFLRVRLLDYRMTTPRELLESGAWWRVREVHAQPPDPCDSRLRR